MQHTMIYYMYPHKYMVLSCGYGIDAANYASSVVIIPYITL